VSYALDRSREMLGDGEDGEDKHGENEGAIQRRRGGERRRKQTSS